MRHTDICVAGDPEEVADDAATRRYGETVAGELAVGRQAGPGSHVVVKNADGVEIHRIYLAPSKNS
jgi:hypothetical protein